MLLETIRRPTGNADGGHWYQGDSASFAEQAGA